MTQAIAATPIRRWLGSASSYQVGRYQMSDEPAAGVGQRDDSVGACSAQRPLSLPRGRANR